VTAPAAGSIVRFPCGRCGAELTFAPGSSQMRCPYCGHENEIDVAAAAPIEELDYAAHLAALAEREGEQDVETVKCGACGAETDRPPELDAFRCAFCGAGIIAETMARRVVRPRAVLPFHVTAEEARAALQAWVRGLWFAPNRFKRHVQTGDGLHGVYLPYWTYDARTVTDYEGQRGEHYWVTESYTTIVNGKPVMRTRQVRKTRWYPAAGRVSNTFDDLLVLASVTLPAKYVQKLEPWDLPNLVPYQDGYLAGFRAERYQVALDAGFAEARQLMDAPIRATIRAEIGGDEQRIDRMDVRCHDVMFKHLLLPVWISAARSGERAYRVVINARTGEVQGERPWSVWKIALAVAAALAVIGAVVAIAGLAGQ
jgi:DNA-directed RNA polymerase subunit RPC12/RpoP